MSATTRVQFVDLPDAGRSGWQSGSYWASIHATKAELNNLADHWLNVDTTETNDAFGPPGVFIRMVRSSDDRDDQPDRQDVDDLWINIGGEDEPREYQYSCEFWDGFVEGALDVRAARSKPALRRAWATAAAAALRIDKCARAIAPYTTGPSKLGHPVLDTAAAVNALIFAAPEPLKASLSMAGLTEWDKVQAFRVALRRHSPNESR